MTLVAIALDGDEATVLTDTLTFGNGEVVWASMSKALVYSHLDMAVAMQGPGLLMEAWGTAQAQLAPVLRDLDAVVDVAPDVLPGLWDSVQEADPERWDVARIYHVGWSPTRGRFAAFEHCSDNAFTGVELLPGKLFSIPAAAPGTATPDSDDAWVELGVKVRDEHSISGRSGCVKTFIGGDLMLTRLHRGESTHRRVFSFPDDDAAFRNMMIGTLHWYGQVGPCLCGSGQPRMVCHMPATAEPCPCGADAPFGDCHLVQPGPDVFAHWTEYRDEFYATRESLRRVFLEARPDRGGDVPHANPIPPRVSATDEPNRAARRAAARRR